VLLRAVAKAAKPAFDTPGQRQRLKCATDHRCRSDRDNFRYAPAFVPYFAEHIGISCCRSGAATGASLHVSHLI
jgi:hypothetical protein